MKTESKVVVSGLKVVGVMALLVSLLLLLPAASAGETYSLTLLANADPVFVSDGDPVTFTFDVDNTGTGTLYDVKVFYFSETEMIEVGDLEGGESASPTAEYYVDLGDITGTKRGRSYIYNTACVVGYDDVGTQLARANAGCTIIVI